MAEAELIPPRGPGGARGDVARVRLCLLATSDLHAHVLPYDYYGDRPDRSLGLALLAEQIATLRAACPNSLLLDNGDLLQGNPMGDLVAERGLDEGIPHPMIAAMNVAGFDAATVGNHDFDYGLEFMLRALEGADFPVISANVVTHQGDTPAEDETLLPPFVILDREVVDEAGGRHPLRIGVIGTVPPQVMTWNAPLLLGRVTTRDPVQALAAWLPRMRAAGADLVVVLAHCGIGGAEHREGMENAALPIAALPGVDAVVAGHSHLVFPSAPFAGLPGVDAVNGCLHGKPAVMPGFWGSHLGIIDLLLDRDPGRGWRVAWSKARVQEIEPEAPSGPAEARLSAAVVVAHVATLAAIRSPVGETRVTLSTRFAQVADCPALALVAEAQASPLREFLAGKPEGAMPVLSAVAPFRAGGRGGPGNYTHIPPGEILLRHLADLYPYPNRLCAVEVTGAELVDWLEQSASLFRRLDPGVTEQMLLDTDFPGYNFDVIHGVTYRIDPTRQARFDIGGERVWDGPGRIRDLRHRGRAVQPADRFIVATNNYRAHGGGVSGRAGRLVYEGDITNREALRRHIDAQARIAPRRPGTWRFVDLPGTEALFDGSPEATAAEAAAADPRISLEGPGPGGFARFRFRF